MSSLKGFIYLIIIFGLDPGLGGMKCRQYVKWSDIVLEDGNPQSPGRLKDPFRSFCTRVKGFVQDVKSNVCIPSSIILILSDVVPH